MSRTIVEKGTSVRVQVTYTNSETGALEDPQAVTVKAMKPDQTVVDLVPTNPSVGVWEAVVQTDQEGTWYARFFATGPGKVDTITFDAKLDPNF